MQNQAKSCHAKIKQCEKIVQNELFLRYIHVHRIFQRKSVRKRRNAPMRVLSLQGDLVDSDPALKEHRTVCFLA